ncbi:DNA replication and repair protein RecF [Pseudogemmatithrix spongiicola]|uniref:DNA replication and repair protein RecF n=1 Tax=Pseudogemmatithrix spongiicola TaxID=3062599 RepID=A0AA49JYB9_9BACT|nr:DNA replication and repair protein RecF [Gemmatimonadaceae bacterium 'strain 138']WKW14266.1 DNA replication and repair protein RecF [Gemmatimonadaceae bacterium 'strain 318']
MSSPRSAQLRALALHDFRNIAAARLELPPEGIALVGENGQGKTNAIEAIAYLRMLRSMRGARDRDLIRHGAPAFHIAAELGNLPAMRATIGADRAGRKKVTLDGAEPEKLTDALDALPSVSFSPRDVDLIAGAPAERRRYLDITLALTSPAYLHALRRYRGALLRRNAALRDATRKGAARTLVAAVAAWEPALAEQGAILVRARRAWAAAHAARFTALSAAIGETQPAALEYAGSAADADDPQAELLAQLERQREQDLRRCLTHAGPHRDDLVLRLDAHDLRQVGSAGQQRTAAIVLRMLESATHREATGVIPALLLDDPFAELDRRRTARILALLEEEGVGQCVLCVPREDEIPSQFTRLQRWSVRAGTFTR